MSITGFYEMKNHDSTSLANFVTSCIQRYQGRLQSQGPCENLLLPFNMACTGEVLLMVVTRSLWVIDTVVLPFVNYDFWSYGFGIDYRGASPNTEIYNSAPWCRALPSQRHHHTAPKGPKLSSSWRLLTHRERVFFSLNIAPTILSN